MTFMIAVATRSLNSRVSVRPPHPASQSVNSTERMPGALLFTNAQPKSWSRARPRKP